MNILFIHQNFPGQFKHLAPALVKRGHDVRATTVTGKGAPGVQLYRYKLARGSSTNILPLAMDFETKLIRAEACAAALLDIKKSGFYPDVIVTHPGWGESLFAKEVFPRAKQLHFLEFYYSNEGGDVGFDPEFHKESFFEKARVKSKVPALLMSMMEMDIGLAPTQWQKSCVPELFHPKIDVVFDGVDSTTVIPFQSTSNRSAVKIKMADGQEKTIYQGDEVLTFVNRNLEPYRGYHVFMRALPQIQRERPNAVTLIVGGDGVSYGAKAPQGKTWKQLFLDEVINDLDMSRIVFLGTLPYDKYLRVMQLSRCHVYLTYPFVLSWSCVEAMSAGCVVVGSKTPPVEEFITHGKTGLLVDFFDTAALSNQVCEVLAHPEAYRSMALAAREHVIANYDLNTVCLPQQMALIEGLVH